MNRAAHPDLASEAPADRGAGRASKGGRRPGAPIRLAYVVGKYPAISHTFILREIDALRGRRVHVITLSIHRPRPEEIPSAADRAAFDTTCYLTALPLRDHLDAHLSALVRRRGHYLSTLLWSMRLGERGPRARWRSLLHFAEAVACWRRCERAGVSHLHGEFCGPASDAAMLAVRLAGSGWTWSFAAHGTDIFQVSRERLASKVEDATFVTCASEFGRAQLMSLVSPRHWEKIEVVRCGVDVHQFAPRRGNRKASSKLRVLSVGRLEREKGHALLLDAAADPALRKAALTVTLIGGGTEREGLEARAARLGLGRRIRFLGTVGQDEIREHYAAADVFCLSSLGEGVPVVLMEAMAMGIPVVAPRLMGIPELVEDGVSGVLFTPGRADDLARALAMLAASPSKRKELGRRGRARVKREFDAGACAGTLAEVLASRVRPAPGSLSASGRPAVQ